MLLYMVVIGKQLLRSDYKDSSWRTTSRCVQIFAMTCIDVCPDRRFEFLQMEWNNILRIFHDCSDNVIVNT
jgi:hypothetical protein